MMFASSIQQAFKGVMGFFQGYEHCLAIDTDNMMLNYDNIQPINSESDIKNPQAGNVQTFSGTAQYQG